MSDTPEYTHDWFTPNIQFLTRVLAPIAHKEFIQALEIGCYEGQSTNWFMENILDGNGSEMWCVDHFEGAPDTAAHNIDFSGVQDRFKSNTRQWASSVRLFVAPSSDLLKIHAVFWNEIFNFIYIDGNHMAAEVLEDAVLAWPLLRPGGIMVFDDYLWCVGTKPDEDKPQLGIDSFLAGYKGKFQIIEQGYQMAVTKIKP